MPLALLRGEPGLHLAPGAEDHNHHLALDPCLSDDNYDFSSAESGSSLRYYSEGESGGGGSSSSLVQLCATLWTLACHAPLLMGFSRQEYWSGLPCIPPVDLPDPG